MDRSVSRLVGLPARVEDSETRADDDYDWTRSVSINASVASGG